MSEQASVKERTDFEQLLAPDVGTEYRRRSEPSDHDGAVIPAAWNVMFSFTVEDTAFDQQVSVFRTPIGRYVKTRYSDNDRPDERVETVVAVGDDIQWSLASGFDVDAANEELSRDLELPGTHMPHWRMGQLVEDDGWEFVADYAENHYWTTTSKVSLEFYEPPVYGMETYKMPGLEDDEFLRGVERGFRAEAAAHGMMDVEFELVERDGSMKAVEYAAELRFEGLTAAEALEALHAATGAPQRVRASVTRRTQQASSDAERGAAEKLAEMEGDHEDTLTGHVAPPYRQL